MYTHAGAQSMTEGIVLHSGRPAADNNTLTLVHLHGITNQPVATNNIIFNISSIYKASFQDNQLQRLYAV